jgi:hypothetical protein
MRASRQGWRIEYSIFPSKINWLRAYSKIGAILLGQFWRMGDAQSRRFWPKSGTCSDICCAMAGPVFTYLPSKGGREMSDYYSHNDARKGHDTFDYDTGSGAGWIWALVVVVAFVGLIALGASGGGDGTQTGATALEAAPPTTEAAPAAD